MNLHTNRGAFSELVRLTSEHIGIPVEAVKRDYLILCILERLCQSEYVENVVFKGGTSLSKCYPGSIERFSEDIDLTFNPSEGMGDSQINKELKKIEMCLIGDANHEKIGAERNNLNKSSWVWFKDDNEVRIKLEIGSSVRPHPYSKKSAKSYIHEYLQVKKEEEDIEKYQLQQLQLNVLDIERTFVDKLFAVKRHAICQTLDVKVRHIYDVVRLYQMPQIKGFLDDKKSLKEIVQLTKTTDSFYLNKRQIDNKYICNEPYNFPTWEDKFDEIIKRKYETLQESLLYTDEKQSFNLALKVFREISEILVAIDE